MWVRILLPLQIRWLRTGVLLTGRDFPLPTVLCQQQNNNGKNRNLRKRVLERTDDQSDLAHMGQVAEFGNSGYGYYLDPGIDHLADRPDHQKRHDGYLSTVTFPSL